MMIQPLSSSGSYMFTNNPRGSNEIIDPVCGHAIEVPQEDLVWQYEGRDHFFHSSKCMDLFKMAPEKYIQPQPIEHQRTTNNNAVTWGLWGAAAGAMMLLMLL